MSNRLATLTLCMILAATSVGACTTLCMRTENGPICAGNYDWDTDLGMLMVNKRYVTKSSTTGNGARWVSAYASVTFNQYGRDNPTGGMNEAGLSIQLMELGESQYPVDNRLTVGVLGWIQYQLDLSATIEEVVRRSEQVRIAGAPGLHYLVGDREGNVATIEYLGGKLVVHSGATLSAAVLTNDTYDKSVARLRQYAGFGGVKPIPNGTDSLDRFVRTASLVAKAPTSGDPSDYLFQALDAVRQPHTRWSMVYDPVALTVTYRTEVNRAVRKISLKAFDLSCREAVKVTDVQLGSGAIDSQFVDYTTEANLDLMIRTFAATPFLAGLPLEAIAAEAKHPESSQCVVARRRSAAW